MEKRELELAWFECGAGQAAAALDRLRAVAGRINNDLDAQNGCQCQWLIAWALFRLGEIEEAFGHAQKAKLLAVQLDIATQARTAALYGLLMWSLGLNDECYNEATRAVGLAERSKEPWALAFSLHVLSISTWMGGDPDTAETYSRRAVDIARKMGDTHLISWLLINLACILTEIADRQNEAGDAAGFASGYERAIAASIEAATLGAANNDSWAQRVALANGAEFLACRERYAEARELLDRWSRIQGDKPNRRIVQYLSTRADMLLREGKPAEALEYCERALHMAEREDGREQLHIVVKLLSEIHEALGEYETALRLLKRYHMLEKRFEGERVRLRSRVAAIVYETAKLRELAEQAEKEAATDPLTGIANRRWFDRVISGLYNSGRDDFALAIIDLDHFKFINDHHSHTVGDTVIKTFARILADTCREGDLVARIGGEEFVLLMDKADLEKAASICARVQDNTHRYDWSAIAPGLVVTASTGLALCDEENTPEALLALADTRLYRAKAEGRDRIVVKGGAVDAA